MKKLLLITLIACAFSTIKSNIPADKLNYFLQNAPIAKEAKNSIYSKLKTTSENITYSNFFGTIWNKIDKNEHVFKEIFLHIYILSNSSEKKHIQYWTGFIDRVCCFSLPAEIIKDHCLLL